MNVYEDLQARGLVADCTDPAQLLERLARSPITLYAGFDPTADSLHVGNLVPLLGLRRFQLHGHHPIAVAGGATGLIGDPSGKTAERQLMTRETLAHNISRQKEQMRRLLDFEAKANPARLLDNADWTVNVCFLDFLREVGKHFSVNVMVGKESVRVRMEDRQGGISYTEFSYMLLQAFDFLHLRQHLECELQIGGSDQWGNITAGIDLCRKKLGVHVYGLTLPLITNADGSKFGKTEKGAVWLDPERTSVYRFYQYWVQTDDRDVIRYLNYFTFLDRPELAELEQQHHGKPEARTAHKALARAVTELVHGTAATADAIRASEILFGGELQGVQEQVFKDVVGEVPTRALPAEIDGSGLPLVDLLVASGLCSSKGQARRDVEGGGIYLNNVRQTDAQRHVRADELLFGKHVLLRKGKRNYVVLSRG